MTSNVTSYDSGNRPFKPDVSRGKWSSLTDFYAVNFSHSFGIKYFALFPVFFAVSNSGILFLIPFAFGVFALGIPIYFIQSFLGQFSSSGFISAFRIAPLFKGIGYAILVINLTSVCYFVVITAYPLVYFFGSFNPTLPWMTCDNSWNTHNCTTVSKYEWNDTSSYDEKWSSIEYYEHAVNQRLAEDQDIGGIIISWRLLLSTIVIWTVIGVIVIQGVEFIGKLLKYFTIINLAILSLIFLRILFLEKAYLYLFHFFVPRFPHHYFDEHTIFMSIVMPMFAFGSGWGTILTMASYNNFNTDIDMYSWVNATIQVAMIIITGIWSIIVSDYLEENLSFRAYYYSDFHLYFPFVGVSYFFGKIEASNLWCLMFFLMLFLAELSGCIIQVLSILTAIFDDYEPLRIYKKGFTAVLLSILFVISVLFTTNEGTNLILHFFNATGVAIIIICFIEVLVVVYAYGRERFQRDVQFLLEGKMFSTWKFYVVQFITPILVLLVLFVNMFFLLIGAQWIDIWDYVIIAIVIKMLPLILIPAYILLKMSSTTGALLERFKRLCQPTDWYPVDTTDRRRYEDVVSATSDNFRQLIDNEDMDLEDMEYQEGL